ncbi:TetR/AcrR family transcriptional regulator [Actinoplanes sp. G11-F43]|uniref:TetR/AcrR family transcriptional regulator n=1 Tax=Actinoplanes sp. G11-F43 TaxID=3424130 RepID=UPI003D3401C6
MPKQVDHEQRRRLLADAVFAAIGTNGYESVSLRDIAERSGYSMGTVQYYFPTKQQMLLFALAHMRDRVLVRLTAALDRLDQPTSRDRIRAGAAVMLPIDEAGREEACVNVAFYAAATVTPAYADQLRAGYERVLTVSRNNFQDAAVRGELRTGTDPDREAQSFYFLTQGLIGPVLLGLYRPAEALALLDAYLDRVFR